MRWNEIWYLMLTCRNALPQSVCSFVNCDESSAESVLTETAPELFHCRKKYTTILSFLKHIFKLRPNWNVCWVFPKIMDYLFNFWLDQCERREHVSMWVYLHRFLVLQFLAQQLDSPKWVRYSCLVSSGSLKTTISKELAYPATNTKAVSRKLERVTVQNALETSVMGHSYLWPGSN